MEQTREEEIFNAAQYVIMQCITNLSDISKNFQALDPYSINENLKSLEDNISTIEGLSEALDLLEGEYEGKIINGIDDSIDEDKEGIVIDVPPPDDKFWDEVWEDAEEITRNQRKAMKEYENDDHDEESSESSESELIEPDSSEILGEKDSD